VQGPITEPRWNIAAGIAYDHMLFERWAAIPTVSERVRFMLASYNAGHQAIKDAQLLAAKEGLDPMRWESIQKSLHDVLGRDSQQTIGYVEEILVIFQSLE
jgi:membrane-bound lytic murein transglycosylase F